MLCPYCKEPNTQVIDSRTCEEGSAIRRRRKCPNCGARFTTYEKAALQMLMRNGCVISEPVDGLVLKVIN